MPELHPTERVQMSVRRDRRLRGGGVARKVRRKWAPVVTFLRRSALPAHYHTFEGQAGVTYVKHNPSVVGTLRGSRSGTKLSAGIGLLWDGLEKTQQALSRSSHSYGACLRRGHRTKSLQ